ncbi:MAG: ThiF family adenylyltransferase [Solirubrobacteraceae bacterium]
MSATADLRPWWKRRPDRLRWEEAEFAERGFRVQREQRQGHDLVLTTSLSLSDGRVVPVVVTFPFEYPRAYPHVYVEPGLVGPPHEVNGALCVLDNPGAQWNPRRCAAELVHENARKLLEDVLLGGPAAVAAGEEQIPDRVSSRYRTDPSHVIMVPDPFWGEPPAGTRRGWMTLKGADDRRLVDFMTSFGEADPDLRRRVLLSEGHSVGRWLAVDDPPQGVQTADTLLPELLRREPDLLRVPDALGLMRPDWLAFTYPEQGPGRGQWRRGWTFIELSTKDRSPRTAVRLPQTQALTPGERQLRLPELVGLNSAKVVLLGIGSLGSKVAVELAKAGAGHLVFFDDDVYDVNNTVRHELPAWLAGTDKALGMALWCRQINPFCQAKSHALRLGSGRRVAEKFLAAIQDADLVIETTGRRAVTRIAERYCRAAGVPLLNASLTRGSRGGDMVLLANEDCFDCFLLAQDGDAIPTPEATEQQLVIPVNCSDPAFSGAGFDASELASIVARFAVRATGRTSYPDLDHNWAVVNFTGAARWRQGTFHPQPECGHHD